MNIRMSRSAWKAVFEIEGCRAPWQGLSAQLFTRQDDAEHAFYLATSMNDASRHVSHKASGGHHVRNDKHLSRVKITRIRLGDTGPRVVPEHDNLQRFSKLSFDPRPDVMYELARG